MNKKLTSIIRGLGVAAFAGAVFPALATEITIADYNPGNVFGPNPGPVGENNETEPGTVQSQIWDLEKFDWDGSTATLKMTGGYNYLTGLSGGLPGMLFIKISDNGEPGPGPNPTGVGSGNFGNDDWNSGSYKLPMYDYAIDLVAERIYGLDKDSEFLSVINDQFKSNPWRLYSGDTSDTAFAVGDSSYVDSEGTHYVASMSLSFLSGLTTSDQTLYFHYTMECGNDMMLGSTPGGFRVPDGGSTLLLLGLSFLGSGAFYRRK